MHRVGLSMCTKLVTSETLTLSQVHVLVWSVIAVIVVNSKSVLTYTLYVYSGTSELWRDFGVRNLE